MRTHVMLLCIPALGFLAGCAPSPCATMKAHKDLFRQYVEAYNSMDINRFDELMAVDFVRHSQAASDVHSLEEFKADVRQGADAFPDGHMEVHMLIAEGDKVAGYMTWSGTQEGPFGRFPATGKKAEMRFFYLFRVKEGKLAEMWVEWDNLGVLMQLGHFSMPESS